MKIKPLFIQILVSVIILSCMYIVWQLKDSIHKNLTELGIELCLVFFLIVVWLYNSFDFQDQELIFFNVWKTKFKPKSQPPSSLNIGSSAGDFDVAETTSLNALSSAPSQSPNLLIEPQDDLATKIDPLLKIYLNLRSHQNSERKKLDLIELIRDSIDDYGLPEPSQYLSSNRPEVRFAGIIIFQKSQNLQALPDILNTLKREDTDEFETLIGVQAIYFAVRQHPFSPYLTKNVKRDLNDFYKKLDNNSDEGNEMFKVIQLIID